MILIQGRPAIGMMILFYCCAFLLSACDEDTNEKARRAKQEAQVQLQQEQTRRIEAERRASAAESSRKSWIAGLGGATCAATTIVMLIGIHIGVRSVNRYRKEHANG